MRANLTSEERDVVLAAFEPSWESKRDLLLALQIAYCRAITKFRIRKIECGEIRDLVHEF